MHKTINSEHSRLLRLMMNDVAKIQFDLPTHMLSVSQIAFQLRQSLIIKPIKRGAVAFIAVRITSQRDSRSSRILNLAIIFHKI